MISIARYTWITSKASTIHSRILKISYDLLPWASTHLISHHPHYMSLVRKPRTKVLLTLAPCSFPTSPLVHLVPFWACLCHLVSPWARLCLACFFPPQADDSPDTRKSLFFCGREAESQCPCDRMPYDRNISIVQARLGEYWHCSYVLLGRGDFSRAIGCMSLWPLHTFWYLDLGAWVV